ncbi:MAG: hypothetical protein ACI857_001529 [Arenicella sp.]|jgi:hypothetical protein
MKLLLLCSIFIIGASTAFSQVSFTILEPASISGGYEFTSNGDAPDWGLANLNNPLDAVLDTVVLADDGTPGLNAQGIPFANEACSTVQNDLTGKIALVYRYDGASTNDCYIGTKVLNAENAGAIGVIVVNRAETVFAYGGTLDGPATSIPFAFISKSDGALIRDKIDNGEDVVAFIGNKLGLYDDDAGIVKTNTLVPILGATASQTSLTSTEFGFDLGTKIYNYGVNTQSNIMLTATLTGPGGTYSETVGPYSIPQGDSIDVFTGGTNDLPAFSFATYPDGAYNLNYTVDIGIADESSFDNTLDFTFVISDSLVSYCDMDTLTNLPKPNMFSRSTDADFTACMVYENDKGGRLGAEGIYFSATMAWNSTLALEGEFVTAYLYQWDDVFTDVNDVNFGFTILNPIADGDYYFDANQDSIPVFAPFDEPVQLADDQRYLACIQTWNQELWLGYNNRIEYQRNIDTYLQPQVPTIGGGTTYWVGFGTNRTPAIALKVFDQEELSIQEDKASPFTIYPNPAENLLTIRSINLQNSVLKIVDLSGRLVSQTKISGVQNTIDISSLAPGQYLITINDDKGYKAEQLFTKF